MEGERAENRLTVGAGVAGWGPSLRWGWGIPSPLLELQGRNLAATLRPRLLKSEDLAPPGGRGLPLPKESGARPAPTQPHADVEGEGGGGTRGRGPSPTAGAGSQLPVLSLCSSDNLSVLQFPHL